MNCCRILMALHLLGLSIDVLSACVDYNLKNEPKLSTLGNSYISTHLGCKYKGLALQNAFVPVLGLLVSGIEINLAKQFNQSALNEEIEYDQLYTTIIENGRYSQSNSARPKFKSVRDYILQKRIVLYSLKYAVKKRLGLEKPNKEELNSFKLLKEYLKWEVFYDVKLDSRRSLPSYMYILDQKEFRKVSPLVSPYIDRATKIEIDDSKLEKTIMFLNEFDLLCNKRIGSKVIRSLDSVAKILTDSKTKKTIKKFKINRLSSIDKSILSKDLQAPKDIANTIDGYLFQY